MSDTMLLGILRMPFDLAMATLAAQIQYHQRGVQAADEIEKRTRERDEARAEVENLYDQVHRWVDDRAKAQLQADRLREQNYELQRERDEARAEIERLRAVISTLEIVGKAADDERQSMRAEVERLRAENDGLREVIRTIRARCVELDDSDAVSEVLDISSTALGDEP